MSAVFRNDLVLAPLFVALLAAAPPAAEVRPEPSVILITWDGVRREDFLDPTRLPRFWRRHAKAGWVLGHSQTEMEVANPRLLSLPGYQSIFAGEITRCADNGCGPVTRGTLAERLVDEGRFPVASVASIASWARIADAVEQRPGTSFVDVGPGQPRTCEDRPPWSKARYDRETFERGLRYLDTHHPRFLFLSFNDADEWAHRGDLPKYLAALEQYDQWLDLLLAKLATMGERGARTTVLLTTDHGRGAGSRWTEHGVRDPVAKWIWLYARGPTVKAQAAPRARGYSHLDLRPTIEALLGLCPARPPMEEVTALPAACPRPGG